MSAGVAREWAAYDLACQYVAGDSLYQGIAPTDREENLMRLAIRCYAEPGIIRRRMLDLARLEASATGDTRPMRLVPPLEPPDIADWFPENGRQTGSPPS